MPYPADYQFLSSPNGGHPAITDPHVLLPAEQSLSNVHIVCGCNLMLGNPRQPPDRAAKSFIDYGIISTHKALDEGFPVDLFKLGRMKYLGVCLVKAGTIRCGLYVAVGSTSFNVSLLGTPGQAASKAGPPQ